MKSKMFLLLFAMFVLATPIFAQTSGYQHGFGDHHYLGYRNGPCFRPLRAWSGSRARLLGRGDCSQPRAGNVIRGGLILGLAFIESLALFTFVVIAAKF